MLSYNENEWAMI